MALTIILSQGEMTMKQANNRRADAPSPRIRGEGWSEGRPWLCGLLRFPLPVVAMALLASCAVGPAYERPASELPAAWQGGPSAGGVRSPGERWWTLYGDPALNQLVDEALAHNQDLALAIARVDEARALARVADSLRYPTVDASANGNRSRRSEDIATPFPPFISN